MEPMERHGNPVEVAGVDALKFLMNFRRGSGLAEETFLFQEQDVVRERPAGSSSSPNFRFLLMLRLCT